MTGAERLVAGAVDAAWALGERLGLLVGQLSARCEVAFEPGVGSARIRPLPEGRARIELDPLFAAARLRDPRDALFLLAHEVMHRVQGDLVRPPGPPAARDWANVVADIRINAGLRRAFFPGRVTLLDACYAEARGLLCLLLPPDRLLELHGVVRRRGLASLGHVEALPPGVARVAVRHALARRIPAAVLPPRAVDEVADWYLDAWLRDTPQAALVERIVELAPGGPGGAPLLGDHGDAPPLPDEVMEELERVAGALEDGPLRRHARRRAPACPADLARTCAALRQALSGADPRLAAPARLRAPTIVPSPGRRDALLLAAGLWPGLFTPDADAPPDDARRARVYLDVSGSTTHALPRLLGLLHAVRDLLADPVHQFSTEVVAVPLAALERGETLTTGGTDFGCVLDDASRRRLQRILVVTDGDGPVPAAAAARARRAGLEVHALLTARAPRSPLRALARSWTELPPRRGERRVPVFWRAGALAP